MNHITYTDDLTAGARSERRRMGEEFANIMVECMLIYEQASAYIISMILAVARSCALHKLTTDKTHGWINCNAHKLEGRRARTIQACPQYHILNVLTINLMISIQFRQIRPFIYLFIVCEKIGDVYHRQSICVRLRAAISLSHQPYAFFFFHFFHAHILYKIDERARSIPADNRRSEKMVKNHICWVVVVGWCSIEIVYTTKRRRLDFILWDKFDFAQSCWLWKVYLLTLAIRWRRPLNEKVSDEIAIIKYSSLLPFRCW